MHTYLLPPQQQKTQLNIAHLHSTLNLFPWCKIIMSMFIFVCMRGLCLQSSLQYECSGTLCSVLLLKQWQSETNGVHRRPSDLLSFTDCHRYKIHLSAQMYTTVCYVYWPEQNTCRNKCINNFLSSVNRTHTIKKCILKYISKYTKNGQKIYKLKYIYVNIFSTNIFFGHFWKYTVFVKKYILKSFKNIFYLPYI